MVVHASMEGAMFNLRGRGNESARTSCQSKSQRTVTQRVQRTYTVDLRSRACPRCQRTVKLTRRSRACPRCQWTSPRRRCRWTVSKNITFSVSQYVYARGLARDVDEQCPSVTVCVRSRACLMSSTFCHRMCTLEGLPEMSMNSSFCQYK